MRRPHRRQFLHLAAGAVVLSVGARPARSQVYPTRPITLVVPFAAGGSFDVIARVITPRLSEILGQQVIVENVGAAAGIVGVNRVAHAVPDGYSVLLGTVGTHAYNPALYKKLPYNPAADFAPVGLVAEQPLVLIARKDFPPNTLPEVIAYAKANAAKLQYGSAGVGSTTHLACALLNAAAGIGPRLNLAASETMDSKAVQDRMHELGATLVGADRRSSEYLQLLVEREIAKWGPAIKAAGISAD